MAQSPRSPKSPGTKFNYNNEDSSFWEKLGTLGRKKKIKEGKNRFLRNIQRISSIYGSFDSSDDYKATVNIFFYF